MAFGLCGGARAQMNLRAEGNKKWDGALDYMIRHNEKPAADAKGVKSLTSDAKVRVMVRSTDSEAVAEALAEAGYQAKVVTDAVLTATLPLSYVKTLAAMPQVQNISSPRQHKPFLNNARVQVGADKVQAGDELETPFTGKGVILGVIDQGFEYRHVAFLDGDGNSRVRALWDRSSYDPNYPFLNEDPTTDIPNGGDEMDAGGHATHVTNIAAGSKVGDNPYYGIAPDAEIIMIPSTFGDDEIIEDIRYIKDFAEKEQKPWVVNMSFGSQMGPHDGTSDYDKAVSGLLTTGGAVVAAMGNEGEDNLHAAHTFTDENGTVYVLVDATNSISGYVYLDVWGNATDGQAHLTVSPIVYKRGSIDYLTDAAWRRCASITTEVNNNNGKEHYGFSVNTSLMSSLTSIGGNSTAYFGVAVTGVAGDGFHAWVNADGSCITNPGSLTYRFVRGDSEYCVAEGGASIPKAIGVGAYVSSTRWTSISGTSYRSDYTLGDMAPFSNYGPSLGDDVKPTISAPGSLITSAVSSYDPAFDERSTSIVARIDRDRRSYYYACMQGTSQATPVVSGIIALWLQANPQLTPENIRDIIKKTAVKDEFTGASEWDAHWGYGKIDAYAGIREALSLKNANGIDEVLNSETPVTLSKGSDAWKVLFNNDETYADIALYAANGACVERRRLDRVRCGQETSIDLSALNPGVYVIQIATTSSRITRRVMVK